MSTTIQEDLAGIAVIKHYTLEESRQRAFRGVNDEYLDAVAGAGAGARRADAAVRDAGRHRDADRAVGGRPRGDRGAHDASAAWSRSTATWCCCRGRRSRSAGSSASGSAASPDGRACASCWRPSRRSPTRSAPGPAAATHRRTDAVDRGARPDDRRRRAAAARRRLVHAAGGRDAGDRRAHRRRARPRWSTRCAAHAGRRAGHGPHRRPRRHDAAARRRCARLIGYAPQDAFLFSATIADNIAFGMPRRRDVDVGARRDERVAAAPPRPPGCARRRRAARRLRHARRRARHHAVGRPAPARRARARARRRRRSILVLDDSLSSVDAETEREILTRLRADPARAARRSLISHRVAAVKDADQILVLDGGRVAERGTHAELLASGGLYAALYREQLAAGGRGIAMASRRSAGQGARPDAAAPDLRLRLAVPGPAAALARRCCRWSRCSSSRSRTCSRRRSTSTSRSGQLERPRRARLPVPAGAGRPVHRRVRAALLHAGDRPARHERPARARPPPRAVAVGVVLRSRRRSAA